LYRLNEHRPQILSRSRVRQLPGNASRHAHHRLQKKRLAIFGERERFVVAVRVRGNLVRIRYLAIAVSTEGPAVRNGALRHALSVLVDARGEPARIDARKASLELAAPVLQLLERTLEEAGDELERLRNECVLVEVRELMLDAKVARPLARDTIWSSSLRFCFASACASEIERDASCWAAASASVALACTDAN